MNKRGAIFFSIVIAIFVFIMGILFLPFLTDDITTARDHIQCTNSSISDGAKLTCLEVDVVAPLFIWFFISISIGLVLGGSI